MGLGVVVWTEICSGRQSAVLSPGAVSGVVWIEAWPGRWNTIWDSWVMGFEVQ